MIKYEQRHERTRAKKNFLRRRRLKVDNDEVSSTREGRLKKQQAGSGEAAKKAESSGKEKQKSKSQIKIQTKV